MESTGYMDSPLKKPDFSLVCSFVMTPQGSISLPVPAVVVMQTMGRGSATRSLLPPVMLEL